MALNDKYKQYHKPDRSPNAKTKQGYYKVVNKNKYIIL